MSAATALARLNALPPDAAEAALCEVCGAHRWTSAVAAARPFANFSALAGAAEAAWDALSREGWIEAFATHPRIGEDHRVSDGKASAWSRAEQVGMAAAEDVTRAELAEAQREYERKFGWTYIVCATGRTAEEMRADCRARLANDPDAEIAVAAAEERRIGRLRLMRLLTEGDEP
ncbi:MAG: 2-oxo-4-hydroxy-4-carboxy-5-ureidoimidazoline decarboxylase [Gemmatimonadota bacterium]